MISLLGRRIVGVSTICSLLFSLLLISAPVSVRADSMTEVQKGMLLNKPGVVFISHYDTVNLVIQSSAGYPQLAGKTYTIQSGSMGSGFVINPDGYIITNGHVVKTPEKQLAYQAIAAAATSILQDIIRAEYQNQGMTPTDAEVESLMPQVIQQVGGEAQLISSFYQSYEAGQVKVEKTQTDIYVQQGAFLSGKKIPIENGMKADIREVDFEGFTDQGEVLGKDIAIIKVSASNMPTVTLGDSDKMQIGDKIYIIGYPGAPTFQEFLSTESQLDASTTSGIISALKTMKDGSQVLQTDTAITHGNSGGPAFNEDGEVIGIASMGAVDQTGTELAGFNYLRPSDVAKEFLVENNITNVQGKTDELYKSGMEYYLAGRYKKSITNFESALRLYPNLLEAEDYLQKSQEGLSNQPFTARMMDYLTDTTYLLIIGLVVVLGVGAFVLVRVMKKEKKMEEEVEILSHEKK